MHRGRAVDSPADPNRLDESGRFRSAREAVAIVMNGTVVNPMEMIGFESDERVDIVLTIG
ncbi:MAG: hypothetical protein P8I99_02000 [Acidimicrobiales bacterium]|nr:hypothetical protein [Acidimicrobiales bacterium]MDG1876169.1 hypothetical protein [Acidimicrobiales bacterium]